MLTAKLRPEETRHILDLGFKYDILVGSRLLDLCTHNFKELFKIDCLILLLVDDVITVTGGATALAVICSMTVNLNPVSVIVPIIGRTTPAHNRVAVDSLALESEVVAPVFNLVEPITLICISVSDILKLHVSQSSLLIYQHLLVP